MFLTFMNFSIRSTFSVRPWNLTKTSIKRNARETIFFHTTSSPPYHKMWLGRRNIFKGCVRYIYAILFYESEREHLSNQEKSFCFSSKVPFFLKKIKFQKFRVSNSMTSRMLKHKTRNTFYLISYFGSKHSLLMKFGQFMSCSKRNNFIKKFYKNQT